MWSAVTLGAVRRVQEGMKAMTKVWYGEEEKARRGFFSFQEVPFFFLKRVEQVKAEAPENMIFGGFVSVGQLRRWARCWLWLKKISKIKVW